jgi:hypothetical protein
MNEATTAYRAQSRNVALPIYHRPTLESATTERLIALIVARAERLKGAFYALEHGCPWRHFLDDGTTGMRAQAEDAYGDLRSATDVLLRRIPAHDEEKRAIVLARLAGIASVLRRLNAWSDAQEPQRCS